MMARLWAEGLNYDLLMANHLEINCQLELKPSMLNAKPAGSGVTPRRPPPAPGAIDLVILLFKSSKLPIKLSGAVVH